MIELPIWFLVLSLFLPRVALIIAFFNDGSFPHLVTKWLSVPMGFLIPRVLIVWGIGATMGCNNAWFWVHLVLAILLFFKGSSDASTKMKSRRA